LSRPTEVPRHRAASPALRAALLWLLVTAAVTALLWASRAALDKAHFALGYLLVVLGAASRAGRTVGLATAAVCFLCFNFFLLPPYYTFSVHDTVDWLVLGAFLAAALVSAELLAKAQQQTRAAEQRAEEIDRLSSLGAETLNAGQAEAALRAIAGVIRSTLNLGSCEIHDQVGGTFRCLAASTRSGFACAPRSSLDDLFPFVLQQAAVALRRADGSLAFDTRPEPGLGDVFSSHQDHTAFLFPLRVRGDTVGILRLEHDAPIQLDAAGRRFMEVLSYYAALGVERVRLQAEAERVQSLREADRLKDAVLAAVSHDLRTPLTTIKALAHELLTEGEDRAIVIVEEADRLNRFVTDLLDLSRLNSGGIPLQLEVNTVDELVAAAVQQTAGILGDHELRARLPAGDILVGRFDSVHALRSLTNLIENAAKYSPRGAPVDLNVVRHGDHLEISVEDRGAGIPPSDQDRMFEPFVRVGRAPDVGGSGLGLSIARRLAEAQGGTVRYAPRPGGGSTFVLELPAEELPLEPR
jgi:two-component system sensor histidine kinase KdpD